MMVRRSDGSVRGGGVREETPETSLGGVDQLLDVQSAASALSRVRCGIAPQPTSRLHRMVGSHFEDTAMLPRAVCDKL
jgi:hypothetical protein